MSGNTSHLPTIGYDEAICLQLQFNSVISSTTQQLTTFYNKQRRGKKSPKVSFSRRCD
jgi:hypothetical protein